MLKILFILKKRSQGVSWGESYSCYGNKKSSGLNNSASFINEMLLQNGIESKLVEVVDNNQIDRETFLFKPNIVIIEAFWVVPEKFAILQKLHPKVKWIIRNHSNWPFASMEGNLLDWSIEYLKYENVYVSCNKIETSDSFRELLTSIGIKNPQEKTPYLPNYYPLQDKSKSFLNFECHNSSEIHIGNFGAIRPLKNNLIQALAAVIFAQKTGKKLFYYINGGRVEGNADPILKSIVSLFNHTPNATLINNCWLDHKEFEDLCSKMDIIMQISFDETFCIVAADAINNNTSLIGSKEIPWLSWFSTVDTTNLNKIVKKLEFIYKYGWVEKLLKLNERNLEKYISKSKFIWLDMCKNKVEII